MSSVKKDREAGVDCSVAPCSDEGKGVVVAPLFDS